MKAMGFESVAVLEGGLEAWRQDFDVEPIPADRAPVR